MRTFTFVFAVIGLAVCLFHAAGLDPKNLILFSLSVPMWVHPAFADYRDTPLLFVYALTIVSWGILGYIVDRIINRSKNTAT